MVIVAMLVTTWLHYRGKRKTQHEMILYMEGFDLSAEPEILIAAMRRMSVEPAVTGVPESALAGEPESAAAEDTIDNMYRGILWMKEKYEQYRDLADQRIEQLKEELAKAEKKYQDLLDAQPLAPSVITTAGGEKQRLEEKDRQIGELREQLQVQTQKTEELVAKLQHSSQLLLDISRELDTSVLPPQAQA